jgi:flagellar FliJ protein
LFLFRFRLEPLLRLRLSERDQRRADLAKALRALEVLRADLVKIEAEHQEIADRARILRAPGGADVDALLATHRYEVLLAAKRRQVRDQIVQVEGECERRRLMLVEADRHLRVLEKLRERREAEHQRMAERREAKQLDEVGILGFIQRQETHA